MSAFPKNDLTVLKTLQSSLCSRNKCSHIHTHSQHLSVHPSLKLGSEMRLLQQESLFPALILQTHMHTHKCLVIKIESMVLTEQEDKKDK